MASTAARDITGVRLCLNVLHVLNVCIPMTNSALEPHGLTRSESSTGSLREADSRLMKHHDLVLIRGPAGCNNAGWGGPSANEWQVALEDHGRGDSASVPQALVDTQTTFAFKRRFFTNGGREESFQRLGKEVSILHHPRFSNHYCIIRLNA